MEDEEKAIVIAAYESQTEALYAKSVLEENGIPCFLKDTNTIALNPLFSLQDAGIRLYIMEKDAKQAEAILKEIK